MCGQVCIPSGVSGRILSLLFPASRGHLNSLTSGLLTSSEPANASRASTVPSPPSFPYQDFWLYWDHQGDPGPLFVSGEPYLNHIHTVPFFFMGSNTFTGSKDQCFFFSLFFSLFIFPTCIFLYFFKFYFIFKIYNIVLVLPNIEMNPPQVYMCSPSWILRPRGRISVLKRDQ